MLLLDALAEERIREAAERGEFDGLPGTGAPLELDDDTHVPADLRAGYRLLRNAGCVPPELAARRELRDVEQLLLHAAAGEDRARLVARVELLLARAGAQRDGGSLAVEQAYFGKIAERLGRRR